MDAKRQQCQENWKQGQTGEIDQRQENEKIK